MADKERGKGKKASGNLLSLGDVGRLAGVPSNTVQKWTSRSIGFPAPVDNTTASKLYSRTAVMKWLRSTGRIK